jgi:putative redox protein
MISSVIHEQSFKTIIRTERHEWIADEPTSLGGQDSGPNPFDYFLSSLGSCIAITLRMYAERKGLALSRISVALTHEKISIQGLGKLDRIERIITLEGDLQAEQRSRLLEIANRCPMYRTLCSDIQIDSTLAG